MYKRLFDIIFSSVGIFLTGWLILLLWVLITITSKQNGMFSQIRIGQYGKPFIIYKLRTLFNGANNKFISKLGKFLRKSKIDEFPQLWNVLIGDMSMVGPRPDIPGYYDLLEGENSKILNLKPGLTGPANLKYANEEEILLIQENPKKYNDEILFPDKVKLNLEYFEKRTLWIDFKIIIYTILRKNKFSY